MKRLPPLTTPHEVLALRNELAEVAKGNRFLLQGGDCAERFDDCCADTIEKKLKILIQMALILTWGGKQRVVKVARLAGQYSKPRSSDIETLKDGTKVPSFRGDNVNRFEPTGRDPDPDRLVQGYFHSAYVFFSQIYFLVRLSLTHVFFQCDTEFRERYHVQRPGRSLGSQALADGFCGRQAAT